MTPQEAIKGLKHLFSENELDLPCQDSLEVRNIAIEGMEKQIPKKVNNLEVFSDIGACIPKIKSGNCPVCNNFMIGNYTYCNDCGQALDWSDSE